MRTARLCLLLCISSSARVAFAQETQEESRTPAETLFVEGRRLMAEGRAEEACAKFAESQRLDPGIGTLLNLARCYARTGRTASAWAAYRAAAGQARATGQTEREAAARAEADRLEPELARLTVTLTAEAKRQSLSVRMDEQPWPTALLGVGAPIDPGEHTLVAQGPGLRPFTTRFSSAPAGALRLEIPALEPTAKPTAVPAPVPQLARDEPWRWNHTAAATMAVIGVAATVTGTIWGLDARSIYESSEPYCTNDACQPQGLSLREDAFDRARLATVAFGAGAAALVSATVLWLARPAPDHFPWSNASGRGSRAPLTVAVQF